MATVNSKNSYLANGDTLVSGGQGPDEPVISSTQIMTGTRFEGLQDADAKLRRYVATASQHGGFDRARKGRLFESVKVEVGSLADTITISSSIAQYDTSGNRISGWCPKRLIDGRVFAQPASGFEVNVNNLSHMTDVPYENAGGDEYNVGIAVSTVASRSFQNPRTGVFELDQETAVIGVAVEPFLVTYNLGLNQITLEIGNKFVTGNTSSLAGRSAMAYYTLPQGETATAIQFGTLIWDGTRNKLVLTGAFGQDSSMVDLTEANYVVCILGPIIAEGAKTVDTDGVAWIAHGDNDTSWDLDGQDVFPSTFALLESLLRMTDPSETTPDLVGIPKVSIRPNDNEVGTSPQFEIWKDNAATSIAFRVDKDGNITFDGVLQSPTPSNPFAFGVDDTSTTPSSAAQIFHTHSSGTGVIGKGPILVFQTETTVEGERQALAKVKTQSISVTSGSLTGRLFFGTAKTGTTTYSYLQTENGRVFVSTEGPETWVSTGGNFDPASSTIDASLISIGNMPAENAIASYHPVINDNDGGRSTNVIFVGTATTAGIFTQARIQAEHDGNVDDQLTRVRCEFTDAAGALINAWNARVFEDDYNSGGGLAGTIWGMEVRGLQTPATFNGQGIRLSNDPSGTGTITNASIDRLFTTTRATAEASTAKSYLEWYISATDGNDSLAGIGFRPQANTGAQWGIVHLPGTGSERTMLNVNMSSVATAQHVAIYQDAGSIANPFVQQQLSGLQVVHEELGGTTRYSGIDIGSRLAGNADGDRSSAMNFLGEGSGSVETRLGGVRCNHSTVVGSGSHRGKMMVWVNDGSGANNIGSSFEMYPDGTILSKTTPIWADIADASPPTYNEHLGFNPAGTTTRSATGVYNLTTFHNPGGGTNSLQGHVNCATDKFYGQVSWTGAQTITVKIWDGGTAGSPAANDDFFVTLYKNYNPSPSP